MTAYTLVDQTYGDGTNKKLPIQLVGTYEFDGDKIIDTDESLAGFVSAGVLQTLSDAQVAAAGGADETVTPVADAQAANDAASTLFVAADGPVEITHQTRRIVLASSTTGAKAMTVASSNPGQALEIVLKAASGGSYTLADVDGGTGTFDAADEWMQLVRNAADDGWDMTLLSGASIV